MKTLLVLGGPTASGKTKLAIEWALTHQTDILSADSRQCYKELTIGVAKPSKEELDTVTHHFIHSHSMEESITAGDYERYGLAVLDSLFQTKDTVICCGGTGLYIKALCEGIDEMPNPDADIKRSIEQDYQAKGLGWLQQEIQAHDPEFYAQAEKENPSRLLRALIFKLSTGQSITHFRREKKKERNFQIKKFYLAPERPILYHRIDERVDQMIIDGLEEEARQLYPFKHLKNLKTVGYQEFFDYFDGLINRSEAIAKIKQHTRNYAKRQLTWFQNEGSYEKISIDYQ